MQLQNAQRSNDIHLASRPFQDIDHDIIDNCCNLMVFAYDIAVFDVQSLSFYVSRSEELISFNLLYKLETNPSYRKRQGNINQGQIWRHAHSLS